MWRDLLKFLGIIVAALLGVLASLLVMLLGVVWTFSENFDPPNAQVTTADQPATRSYANRRAEWSAVEMNLELERLVGAEPNYLVPAAPSKQESSRDDLKRRLSIYEASEARSVDLRKRMAKLDEEIQRRREAGAQEVKELADQYERSIQQRKRMASTFAGGTARGGRGRLGGPSSGSNARPRRGPRPGR